MMDSRVSREKEIYDRGELQRDQLANIMGHLRGGPERRRRTRKIISLMQVGGKDVLEIGSTEYFPNWVDFTPALTYRNRNSTGALQRAENWDWRGSPSDSWTPIDSIFPTVALILSSGWRSCTILNSNGRWSK